MNREEAKSILMLHRPGIERDAQDTEMTEALTLAKTDPELANWLKEYLARQASIRAALGQIATPQGLREQIISEHAAAQRASARRKSALYAVFAVLLVVLLVVKYEGASRRDDNSLPIFQNRMVSVALRGYAMDLETNDIARIREFLGERHAPSDFTLPLPLANSVITGCAVESWENTKVSMICFRTAKGVANGVKSDLWLFVVDASAVKGGLLNATQLARVNQLFTAAWLDKGKLYLLGTAGDEEAVKRFL